MALLERLDEILAQVGLPSERQGVDLINTGEQLLCRARAVGRRVEARVRARVEAAGRAGPDEGGWAPASPPAAPTAFQVWHKAAGCPDWLPVCAAASHEEAEAAVHELAEGPPAWLFPPGGFTIRPGGERPA
jgi:hypothetical protein